MALPGKSHYKLSEAAALMSGKAGETVSIDLLLDWAAQQLFAIEVPLSEVWLIPEGVTVGYNDRERNPQWLVSGLVEVEITAAQVQALMEKGFAKEISLARAKLEGKPVVVNKRGFERSISFSRYDILISAAELDRFMAKHFPIGAPPPPKVSVWPWGTHNTELLGHLARAAEKFWNLYDQNEPSTAPTNAQVTKWLEDQGVAKRVAEVMAQILRADDLPTGPRK